MSNEDRHPVEALGEEYLARRRRGEITTIEDYAREHPEFADEIRELFPAMEALETLKSATGSGFTRFDHEAIEELGDFRVIGEIGRGGMGVVYEVEQKTLGRRVALKVLPRQMVADDARRERFEREAQTAAGLHHTNIVPIFGVGEADGHHFYVMQLIRGVGLDRILAALRGDARPSTSSSLTESMLGDVVSRLHDVTSAPAAGEPGPMQAEAPGARSTLSNRHYYRSLARIGLQIADALDHAHGAGTLHRDIKPANLLLDATGTAWITDFGLAKALEQSELTRTGDVIGTLRYMAPEQMRGQFDRRSDIFSLGLTLYELATLQPAFQGRDRAELVRRITEGEIPRVRRVNPHCPLDLATIVEKACANEPRDRYATAGELHADLRRFLDDRPIEARRVSTVESVWRWCRRNRALASAAAIALLALVTAGVTGWIGWVTTRDALADAREANELAEANLRLSLDAFGTLFDEVCGDDALAPLEDRATDTDYAPATSRPPSPDTLPLLQHILEFYDKFAERNADNELLAWEIAAAHRRMGEIRFRLGRFEEAIASFEEALERFDRATEPKSANGRLERAFAWNRIGTALLGLGKFEPAVRAHERALRTVRDGFVFESAPIAWHLELADARNQLGVAIDAVTLHRERARQRLEQGPGRDHPPPFGGRRAGGPPPGRPQAGPENDSPRRGESHHRSALDALEALHAEHRTNPDVRFATAHTRRLLGRSLLRRFDATAADEFARAIATLEELVAEWPGDVGFRFELAEALVDSGRTRVPGPHPMQIDATRRENLAAALAQIDALLSEDPNSPAYREARAGILYELGLGDWDDRELDRAVETLRDSETAWAELAASFPSVPQFVHHWTDAAASLHGVLLDHGEDPLRSVEFARARLAALEALGDRADRRVVTRGRIELLMRLAEGLEAAGQPAEAANARREARDLRPPR